MQGPKLTDPQVKALAAYLRSLPPPPSRASVTGEVDLASAARGKAVFARQECADCHEPPRPPGSLVPRTPWTVVPLYGESG